MAGTKRAAEDSGRETRSKAAKPNSSSTPSSPKSKRGAKKGAKAALPTSQFKSKAMPLHVNITHTPPSVLPAEDSGEPANAAAADPGFIGTLALTPNSFSTGSYGWKGSKRITVELLNGEGEEKEKVQVMLTINATVLGSKGAEGDKADAEEAAEEKAEENGEAASAEEKAEES